MTDSHPPLSCSRRKEGRDQHLNGSIMQRHEGRADLGRLTLGCALWFLFTFIACTDGGTDVHYTDPEGVIVQAGTSSLEITNRTGKGISVFVLRDGSFVDWVPLCNDTHIISHGSTTERPYAAIAGYSPGCTVVVYWWGCTPTFDGRIRVLTVKTGS